MHSAARILVAVTALAVVAGHAPPTEARLTWREARLNLRQAAHHCRVISRDKTVPGLRRFGLALRAGCRSLGLRREAPPAVLVYQGAFDPVHAGHLTNIKSAVQGISRAGHVFVVPTSEHPGKRPVAYEHRVAMMAAALAGTRLPRAVGTTVVQDPHVARLSPEGFGALTSMIHMRFPGSQVYIMTGSDAYLKAAASGLVDRALRWGYRYAVTPRAGYPLPDKLPTGVEVMPLAGGEISSSKIRGALAARKLPVELLGKPAARYIAEHGLYGFAAGGEAR